MASPPPTSDESALHRDAMQSRMVSSMGPGWGPRPGGNPEQRRGSSRENHSCYRPSLQSEPNPNPPHLLQSHPQPSCDCGKKGLDHSPPPTPPPKSMKAKQHLPTPACKHLLGCQLIMVKPQVQLKAESYVEGQPRVSWNTIKADGPLPPVEMLSGDHVKQQEHNILAGVLPGRTEKTKCRPRSEKWSQTAFPETEAWGWR